MKISQKAIAKIERRAETMSEWKANAEQAYNDRCATPAGKAESFIAADGERVQAVHVTIPSPDHKLADMLGINTSVTNNPYCIARRAAALKRGDLDCVCLKCYAENLLCCFKPTELAALYNQHILTSHLLTDEEIAAINLNTDKVRFEMFGDVSNVTQARNYIRIAKANKYTAFGAWSKNWNLWLQAFAAEGKPENLTFVYSSYHLDKVDEVPAAIDPYVDYVFTVCSDKNKYNAFLAAYADSAPCAGISCNRCAHCYHRGNNRYVFELLR